MTRRRFQFSLRMFLLFVVAVSALFGWIGIKAGRLRLQQRTVSELRELGGRIEQRNGDVVSLTILGPCVDDDLVKRLLCFDMSTSIGRISAKAQQVYPGGRTDALLAMLHSDTTDVREKNRVVWALGEIRDSRALPALRDLETDGTCDHSSRVCQYEVQKAVDKISGEIPDPYPWQW